MIANDVAERWVPPLATQLGWALAEAIGPHPETCHASDAALRLTVTPLDATRVIVLGERLLDEFVPRDDGDAGGNPHGGWYASLARYYDRAWIAVDYGNAAETILEDFAPAVFAREAYQHHTLR
ncbi:MAG: hypothetical protein ABS52_19480 [Gemmatimonadetes bacterium SCN 70-22]|nr:MAG: hypothetical protein ABS52_19480 [Gemmatimonadetes bacterium SCN 70-22]